MLICFVLGFVAFVLGFIGGAFVVYDLFVDRDGHLSLRDNEREGGDK